eukprot:scpid88941/ scgid4892/ 
MPHESKQRVHSPPSTQRQRSLSAPAEATGAQRRRRTFTTNQFNYVWRPSYQRNAGEAFGRKRPSSPNRHHNPHPLGLATQEPYNKDNAVFGTWNPSMNLILQQLPEKITHANESNFTAGHISDKAELSTDYGSLADAVGQPKYRSLTAVSFRSPDELSRYRDHTVPISRYGSNTHRMASSSGIVPNALRPWQTDKRRKPPSNYGMTSHKDF